ncbi:MAG: ABC transporter permease [Planctomycetes bacterium]|nr:ABC transporter permease [Planctomycetota bacterium]
MYKILLASRYLIKRRISYLAFLAVALCVFIVIVVMTVMIGLVSDFKEKNHSFAGDCVVGTDSLVGFAYYADFADEVAKLDFVESTSTVINTYGLINRSGTDVSRGVQIFGIDPKSHSLATGFGRTVHYHKDDISKVFVPAYDTNLPGCVLGIDMAMIRDLRGKYQFGQMPFNTKFSISCFPLTAKGALAKAGAGEINTKTFSYSDVSQSGLARIDSSLIYIPFEQAQLLCGMGGVDKRASRIHIKFKSDVRLGTGTNKVGALWRDYMRKNKDKAKANLFETVTVQTWKEHRRSFVAAMEKEQTVLTVMFSLVGITTVFIIFVVFYMIICHKSKDIGILKSIGVSNSGIIGLFSSFAVFLASLGSCMGVFGGWLFLRKINSIEDWLFARFGFQMWDRSIYAIGDIPNQIELRTVLVIIISAFAACLVGAIVPAWQGAKLRPVESLQVNQL